MYTPSQRLLRSRTDKMIAGVAGGVGQYLGVDPVIVRLAFVALVFTGVGALLYPVLWLIMPLEGGVGSAPSQAFSEMQQQATRLGDEVREVFVAGGRTRTPRYDPMTGAPLGDEAEIPINNVGSSGAPASDDGRRSRLLGTLLIGAGAFIALSMLLGPAFGRLLLPLLLVAVGVIVLRRGR